MRNMCKSASDCNNYTAVAEAIGKSCRIKLVRVPPGEPRKAPIPFLSLLPGLLAALTDG